MYSAINGLSVAAPKTHDIDTIKFNSNIFDNLRLLVDFKPENLDKQDCKKVV